MKIVATRSHLLQLKYAKVDFGCGSALGSAGEAHSALPDIWLDFRGPTSKGRKRKKQGKGGKGGRVKRGRKREEGTKRVKEGEGKRDDPHTPFDIFGYATALGA